MVEKKSKRQSYSNGKSIEIKKDLVNGHTSWFLTWLSGWKQPHGELNYYIAQTLTSHECFKRYLNTFKIADFAVHDHWCIKDDDMKQGETKSENEQVWKSHQIYDNGVMLKSKEKLSKF